MINNTLAHLEGLMSKIPNYPFKWVVELKVCGKNTIRKMERETGLGGKSLGRMATMEESFKITSLTCVA